jgi:hypothetical protein
MPNAIQIDYRAQCTADNRGPLGLQAGDAVLWQIEDTIREHGVRAKLPQPGFPKGRYGTYYGSEWPEKAAKNNKRQAQKWRERLSAAGVKETNCVELMLWAVELYYAAMADLAGPQGNFFTANKPLDCKPELLLQAGQRARDRARDARSKGALYVRTARGTTLAHELRELDNWKTVYFSPERSEEAKNTQKKMVGPLTGRAQVPGAVTNDKIDVRVGFDKVITGFSTSKEEGLPEDMRRLLAVPFAVGFFEWGYHTYVLGYGWLYEVHWKGGPMQANVFEKSRFLNAMQGWNSGGVAVPPEGWPFE